MAEEVIKKGKIIVVEGTDCSGEETQTSLLVQRLRRMGRKIERLSFPMYDTPTGADVDPKVASLYYAADRRYNKHVIEGYLNKGYDVVLDRYVESNMAHQGGKLFDKEDRLKLYKSLDDLEYGFLELPRPDFTIFLYVPYDKVAELRGHRSEAPDQHESNPLHIRNAEHAYLELADLHNYQIIKCCDKKGDLRDIENIQEEIYDIVVKELEIK